MSDQINFGQVRPLDGNGAVSPGAKAYFFEPGTTTPKTVYTDSTLTTAHASPLLADASGQFAQVFSNGGAKVVVTDADDVTLPGYPLDPAFKSQGNQSSASNISFDPTEDIATDNVQGAIESVRGDMGDITDAGRALIDDEDAEAQRATLELENVAKTSPQISDDADNISEAGFYILTAGATNSPSANDCSAAVAREDADNIIVTATDAVTGDVYTRSKVAGVWGAWVRMARAGEVPGLGQRWEDASSEYSSGIAYQNTESREIEFTVTIDTGAGSGSTNIEVSHDGVTWVVLANISGNNGKVLSFSVPPLGYFRSSNAGAVLGWKVKRTV